MKPGTKPMPRELKVIEGVVNKRRIPQGTMEPDDAMPDKPLWLTGYGAEVWDRLAPELNRIGVLRVTDGGMFAAYCQTEGEYRAAVEEGVYSRQLDFLKQMRPLAAEFGLTPSSRGNIHTGQKPVSGRNGSKARWLLGETGSAG